MKQSFSITTILLVFLSTASITAFSQDSSFRKLLYMKEKMLETQVKINGIQKKIQDKYKPVKSAYVNSVIGQPIVFFTAFQNTFNKMFSTLSTTVENPTILNMEECWSFFSKSEPELKALLAQFEIAVNAVQHIELEKFKDQLTLFEYPRVAKNVKLAVETAVVSMDGVKQLITGITGTGNRNEQKGQSTETTFVNRDK